MDGLLHPQKGTQARGGDRGQLWLRLCRLGRRDLRGQACWGSSLTINMTQLPRASSGQEGLGEKKSS